MSWLTTIRKVLFGYEEPVDNTFIPRNLEECFTELDIIITQADPQDAADFLKESDANKYHFFFGMQIRNNWKLWQPKTVLHEWFKERGIWHADDMSSIILNSYLRVRQGRPIDLEEQIKYYQDYWKENPS
jgi:hypothetical protein